MKELDNKFINNAISGGKPPVECDIVDLCAHYALWHLGELFRLGKVEKNEASERKLSIVNNWKQARAVTERNLDYTNQIALRVDTAATKYYYESTVENADKMYAAFFGLPEDWRRIDKEEQEK